MVLDTSERPDRTAENHDVIREKENSLTFVCKSLCVYYEFLQKLFIFTIDCFKLKIFSNFWTLYVNSKTQNVNNS